MSLANHDIFISHSNEDAGLIERLLNVLQSTAFKGVIAQRLTEPSSPIAEKVASHIDSCGCFLAVFTEKAQASQWVQHELGYVYRGGGERDKPVAVLVKDDLVLGGFYTGLEYFNFTDETFEKTVGDAVRYFEKLDHGDLKVELRVESDAALRKMIDELRADTLMNATKELREHIEPLLDSIVANFATAFMKPELGIMARSGLDNFFIRTETFIDLMNEISAPLKESGKLGRALERAGTIAGRSFGADFCDQVLLKNKVAVESYQDLIDFWLYYDQTSGWGELIRCNEVFPAIAIEFANSFLVRRLPRGNSHQYCDFLRGYINGFLQFTLRRVPRCVRQADRIFHDSTYSANTVTHTAIDGHRCRFALNAHRELRKLRNAFDRVFSAELANNAGDSIRCLNNLRAAMELGVKGLLEISEDDHKSFHVMVKELFTQQRAQRLTDEFRPLSVYRDLYGQISADIHRVEEPDESECRKMILMVDEFLNALERTEPSDPE